MKRQLIACTGLVLALAAGPTAQEPMAPQTFKGTLIDNACFKTDMPQEELDGHTRECALMDGCMKSGYAVVTADKHVYKLDTAGNEKAIEALEASEQAGNLKVTVTGVNEMGTIKVQTIAIDK